jgi:hypothetical protein
VSGIRFRKTNLETGLLTSRVNTNRGGERQYLVRKQLPGMVRCHYSLCQAATMCVAYRYSTCLPLLCG